MKGNFYNSSIGRLLLIEDEVGIKEIRLIENIDKEEEVEISESDNIKLAIKELEEYFEGKRREFTFNISIKGTEFQKKVWKELIKIPYGETRSYKEIAKAIGNENASRAVGNANNKNKILIVIPCHRVLGKNGSLVGYAYGIDKKDYLLKLEN